MSLLSSFVKPTDTDVYRIITVVPRQKEEILFLSSISQLICGPAEDRSSARSQNLVLYDHLINQLPLKIKSTSWLGLFSQLSKPIT